MKTITTPKRCVVSKKTHQSTALSLRRCITIGHRPTIATSITRNAKQPIMLPTLVRNGHIVAGSSVHSANPLVEDERRQSSENRQQLLMSMIQLTNLHSHSVLAVVPSRKASHSLDGWHQSMRMCVCFFFFCWHASMTWLCVCVFHVRSGHNVSGQLAA